MGILRLLLALAVLLGHVQGPGGSFQVMGGRLAVECFYVISGFYMALVLDRKYPHSTLVFLFNRVVRLYPAYLALSLLAAAVSFGGAACLGLRNHFAATCVEVWPHLGLAGTWYAVISNLLIEGKDLLLYLTIDPRTGLYHLGLDKSQVPANQFQLLPQAWSLGLEFNFYLLSPWLVRLRSRTILWIIGATFILKFLIHLSGHFESPWDYRFFPAEIGVFLIGSLGYRLSSRLGNAQGFWNRLSKAAVGLFLASLLCAALAPAWLDEVGAALAPLALLGLALPWIFERTRHLKWDRALGELSYAVYLDHLLVIDLLNLVFVKAGFTPAGAIQVSVASVALAWLLRRFIESPVDRWRHRLSDRWMAKPA
jgi:peptidoglycan/LPS O-acetylase OafA/YrhL